MNTIFVDDELWELIQFETESANIEGVKIVGKFSDPYDALDFAKKNRVDLAFLDVIMPGMNGIELAKHLRDLYQGVIIIFVSAYDEYIKETISINADYYLMKPYTSESVRAVFRRALLLSKRIKKEAKIKTFGEFEIYVRDERVKFTSTKAKELMAILVDRRGRIVDAEEAFSLMWPDKYFDNVQAGAYRRALQKLKNTLEKYGIGHIMETLPHGRAVNVGSVDCDYYAFLDGDVEAINNYEDNYMIEYKWAAATRRFLRKNKQIIG